MATINALGVALSGIVGSGKFAAGSTIGTWTPVFTFVTIGDLSVSYATQAGTYNYSGSRYTVNFTLTCTPTYTTSSGSVQITGLPKASNYPSNVAIGRAIISTSDIFTSGHKDYVLTVSANSSQIGIVMAESVQAAAGWSVTQVVTGVPVTVNGSLTYLT